MPSTLMVTLDELLKADPEAVARLARFVGAAEPSARNACGRRFRQAANVLKAIRMSKEKGDGTEAESR